MRRSHHAAPLPECAHTTEAHAVWNATRAYALEAEGADPENDYSWSAYNRDHPRPDWGPCAACKLGMLYESPWRPELWDHLHTAAGTLPKGGRVLLFDKPGKLPPTPKARREKNPATLHARIMEGIHSDTLTPRETSMVGKTIGPDDQGHWYRMDATNGHTALISPVTPEKGQEKCLPYIAKGGTDWIDLPEGFHLALKRVHLLANERSGAIKCEYDGRGTLTLTAGSPEYGTASETVDVDTLPPTPGEVPAPFTCTLAEEYLDLACGIWPLRWYLARPVERHEPPSRYQPKGRTWTEDLPQHFEPAGAGWRFVVMPMRMP